MEGYKFWIHLTLSLTSVRSIGMRLISISDDNNTQAKFLPWSATGIPHSDSGITRRSSRSILYMSDMS